MENEFLILNTITAIATIYFIISVPTQIFKRFKKKRNGEVVTPTKIIVKKILKYWLVTAVVLMSLATFDVYNYLKTNGASNDVIASAMVSTTLGNILTSFVIGYAFMMLFRHKWSHSANQWNFEKINRVK